jgi:hypothetical protein
MENVYPSETLRETAAMKRLRTATLIADLSRSVALLTVDIEEEEERVGVHDVSAINYPVLARSLRVRKENLEATINALEQAVPWLAKAA